ncbi:MAG TPA: hypothetical protein VJQ25_11215 [Nitrospira sp.]|nr:hypothetical protein [Nitrospira sp.]
MYIHAPDWVMLGVTVDDGVLVFASDELTQAELREEVDVDIMAFGTVHVVDALKHYELNAETRSFTWARGATYAEAIQTLMRTWAPSTRPTRAINEGIRELNERN